MEADSEDAEGGAGAGCGAAPLGCGSSSSRSAALFMRERGGLCCGSVSPELCGAPTVSATASSSASEATSSGGEPEVATAKLLSRDRAGPAPLEGMQLRESGSCVSETRVTVTHESGEWASA